jgi:hypothetical protein
MEKAAKKVLGKPDKKRSRKRKEFYGIYIFKVLKQVDPQIGVSSKSMGILDSFVNDIFERLAGEASQAGQPQEDLDPLLQGRPDHRPAPAARRAGQARHLRGVQGRHKVQRRLDLRPRPGAGL